MKSKAKWLLIALLLYFAAINFGKIWRDQSSFQWDFKIYYNAAIAQNQGLDPYDIESLRDVSGEKIWLPYVYSPLTIYLFKLFTLLSYPVAFKYWLILKSLFLLGLIYIWKRYFLFDSWSVLFLLLVAFGFDGAVYWDFKAGNITIFEQFFLWAAFAALLKERPIVFILFLIPAALFKFTLIIFALLPLIASRWKDWKIPSIACGTFLLLNGLSYIFQPHLFTSFLDNVLHMSERANDYNYGLLAFFRDFADRLLTFLPGSWLPTIAIILYAFTALAIAVVTIYKICDAMRKNGGADLRQVIFAGCLAYALILPRFKCYAFILLLAPTFYILFNFKKYGILPLLLLLLLIPVQTPFLEGPRIDFFFNYYLLFIAFALWFIFIRNYPLSAPESDIGPDDIPLRHHP